IYINSPGGSFTALTAIYDTMQYIRPEIQTYCMGQAASAAAVLLAAGTKGKRYALPQSRILIHQPSGGTEGPMQISDLDIQAREIQRMRLLMEEILARHTGQPLEQIRQDVERDKIFTAEQAKEYGIVDDVIFTRKLFNSGILPLRAGASSSPRRTRRLQRTSLTIPGTVRDLGVRPSQVPFDRGKQRGTKRSWHESVRPVTCSSAPSAGRARSRSKSSSQARASTSATSASTCVTKSSRKSSPRPVSSASTICRSRARSTTSSTA